LLLPRCYFDRSKCARRFGQYRSDYDEKLKTFKDKPRHDWTSHAADACRYMTMAYQEIEAEPPRKEPRYLTDLTIDESPTSSQSLRPSRRSAA
jgi:hypothetical protein